MIIPRLAPMVVAHHGRQDNLRELLGHPSTLVIFELVSFTWRLSQITLGIAPSIREIGGAFLLGVAGAVAVSVVIHSFLWINIKILWITQQVSP